ncbi:MAG: squalene/phytoene synthase family protein [Alphaproteobacteria bacterium]|nr:squalene/phytoene synthase family protein [Alphaproteobacteria bacterium SS10]
MSNAPDLSYCGAQARENDPDRFLTSLFAPVKRREAIWALLAFNQEIAKTREVVSETTIGHIRLQWWRDAIVEATAGTPRRHAVVEPLADAVQAYGLPIDKLSQLIDARETDLEAAPPSDLAALEHYADATTTPLTSLVISVLGGDAEQTEIQDAARSVSVAFALVGQLRAILFQLGDRHVMLPDDLLQAADLTAARVADRPKDERIRPIIKQVADCAEGHLTKARRYRSSIPRKLAPAFMIGTLAGLQLKQMRAAGYDPFDQRMASSHPLQALSLTWRAPFGLW